MSAIFNARGNILDRKDELMIWVKLDAITSETVLKKSCWQNVRTAEGEIQLLHDILQVFCGLIGETGSCCLN